MRAGFAEGRLTEITKLIGELFEAVAVLVHGHLALVEAVVLGFNVDGASHLVVEEDAMDVTPDEELLAPIDLPMEPERSQLGQIDPRRARFPCCIVWTPIPFITWLVPFIGHIGICREDGVILDFAGPYFISVDNFAFGAVARYIQVNGDECYKLLEPEGEATWDDALKKGTREFQDRNYNLFTCNCHSFVANNLNRLFYSGHDKWNVVSLATVMFLQGRWVSTASMVKTFLPSVILIIIGTLLGGTTFLIGLLAFASVMTGWFLIGTYCIKGLIEL